MEQNSSTQDHMLFYYGIIDNTDHNDNAWQTVSYRKKNKRLPKITPSENNKSRKTIELPQLPAVVDSSLSSGGSKSHSGNGSDTDTEDSGHEVVLRKVVKAIKPKKPKVTVAQAATFLDVHHLQAYLLDITAINETQTEVQLMQFADYFGKAFSAVKAAQFPWLKIFREASVTQMVDMPLCHIPEDVYKTSVSWIGKQSHEELRCFVLWLSDKIFADHQALVSKTSRKYRQQLPSKSLIAIFVVLAMVLRRKPDVLINLLPILNENPRYQAEENLPVTIWMIVQASEGDLVVGLYMWTRFLLPMLSAKSNINSRSGELILQLLERILSSPKSRPILLSRPVRKSERLIPPSAFELLMRISFPASSTRTKSTERFEAVYPTLKDIALTYEGSKRKAMKQVIEEILNFAIKAAGEGIPDLSREASSISVWCLAHDPECYKQWEMVYLNNLEASVMILRKLQFVKHSSLESLKDTLKSFMLKNAERLGKAEYSRQQASLRETDRLCKAITRRVSKRHGCMKSILILSAVSVGAVILSLNILLQNL
ncbi:hypothetical protein M5689_007123 [Euphorbia peplus]|nr:hypothetical protein M5689_007123 [Euphorbia peplus]